VLICKGFAASFLMYGGETIKAPASYGLLHDPTGRDFSKCSGLVAPFSPLSRTRPSKGGGEIDDGAARDYFGHPAREGEIVLPPRALSAWKRVGVVAEIYYTRRRPGNLPTIHKDHYYHPVEGGRATLYRRGKLLRVELGGNCEWNVRGIVRP
jgi:hypothetical protein